MFIEVEKEKKKHLPFSKFKSFSIMKHVLLLFTVFTIAFTSFAQNPYTLHQVAENETLYRLSVNYKIPVPAILAANPEIQDNVIKVGQIVRIPPKAGAMASSPSTAKEQTVNNRINQSGGVSTPSYKPQGNLQQLLPITHKVVEKETLYAISRKYKQDLEAIRNWNGVINNNIRLGQLLVVGWTDQKGSPIKVPSSMTPPMANRTTTPATTTTTTATAPPPAAPTTPPKAPTPPKKPKTSSGIDYTATAPNPYTGRRRGSSRKSLFQRQFERNDQKGYKRIATTGMGYVFDDSSAGGGLFILHKTAPLQSIVKVTNPVNGKIIYLKVLQRVPNTGVNDKVIAHIPKSVARKLNLLDARPRISTVYHKPR